MDDALEDLRDLLEEASVRRYPMELVLRDGRKLTGRVKLEGDRLRVGSDTTEVLLAEIRSARRANDRTGRCG